MFTKNSKLKSIFVLGFLASLQLAFTSFINSSFLSLFSGEKNVGLIYALGSLISLFVFFFIPGIFRKIGGYKFLLYLSGLNALSLLLLASLKSPVIVISIFIFYFTLNHLIVFALDELLQIFSKNSLMGKMRGLYLSIVGLAWVISQALSIEILSKFSFSALYFIAFIIMAIFFVATFWNLKNLNDPKYDKVFVWQSFKNFFINKNLARAYKINFLLQFFYVWMIIYTPIYLYAHLGFSLKETAMIFTVMLLPFVLIQFPLGEYSDKIGERKMMMLGFLIMSISTLSLFLIQKHEIWIWATVLFSTRIGAAITEVMSDVYFFKHINMENDEFISIYRNSRSIAYIIAPLIAFIIFLFTPSFNYIFLILGAIMLYGIYLSSTINRSDI
ncbi:MAG: MFS transporter [Candidatus Paceibacterota bacterium]|jgi:MFS family permease